MHNALLEAIRKHLTQEIADDEVTIDMAPHFTNADFASPVAFGIAKKIQKDPKEIAQKLSLLLQEDESIKRFFKAVEASGGFVNFSFSEAYLYDALSQAQKEGENFGKGGDLKGQKIMVEFTDPNPFKEFHIGHLYSNTVGECISRLLESQGALVERANYQGDVGLHVAKALWGLMQQARLAIEEIKGKSLKEQMKFLGEAYALGARMFEEDEKVKAEIQGLNKSVYRGDKAIQELYDWGRKLSLEYFEEMYKRLGTKFDVYYFEREAAKEGEDIVREYEKKGIFEKSEKAIVFKGERYGLHTRVFINSQGLPTYEAKDLALASIKYRDFPYDQSIIVTANEVDEYFKVVLAALRQVNPQLAKKTRHISHGVVRFAQGKMSSRLGNIVTAQWLLDEVKENILQRMESSKKDMERKEAEKIAETVAVGAVKYVLLKSGIGKDSIFDLEEAISLEGFSGPYLQYTYVRTQSILAKAGRREFVQLSSAHTPLEREERDLIRFIAKFPDVVALAAKDFSPSLLCRFLFELAGCYNTFYNGERIVGSKREAFRLILTSVVGNSIKQGLSLLGIGVPEKM